MCVAFDLVVLDFQFLNKVNPLVYNEKKKKRRKNKVGRRLKNKEHQKTVKMTDVIAASSTYDIPLLHFKLIANQIREKTRQPPHQFL